MQPIPTHLAGILEARTAVLEYVPAGSASTSLTLKRTTVLEAHERAIDHFVFEVQGETKLPAQGPRLCVEFR